MAVVYFYIPAQKLGDVIDCGLKLSEWKDKIQATPWVAEPRPCLCALLHPQDDLRYRDASYQCIKLNVPADKCIVADGDLFQLSMEHPQIRDVYIQSMVPLQRYRFGIFRRPECLIFSTILAEQIRVYGKGLDEPILYQNSETLYVNSLLERYNDRYENVNTAMLYSYLMLQKQSGRIDGFTSSEKRLAVFFDEEMNHHITVSIPDLKRAGLIWPD